MNLDVHFLDRENTGIRLKYFKMFLQRNFVSNVRKILKLQLILKMKVCTRFVVRYCYNLLAFVGNFELVDIPVME